VEATSSSATTTRRKCGRGERGQGFDPSPSGKELTVCVECVLVHREPESSGVRFPCLVKRKLTLGVCRDVEVWGIE
jgi:hypothetical protein